MKHFRWPEQNTQSTAHWPRAARLQRRLRFLRLEVLEPRRLLDGAGGSDYGQVSSAWFAAEPQIVTGVEASPLSGAAAAALAGSSASVPATRWLVRLTASATAGLDSVRQAERLLDGVGVDVQILRGLGLRGQLLVRSFASEDASRAAFAANVHVAEFEPEGSLSGQWLPNAPDFPSLTGLHNVGQFDSTPDADIDAPGAWDLNTGSTSVVVGVIDSGIDVTHPDLYLNWLNQGEIPGGLRSQLVDTDGDSRITFYDLNDPANATLVRDANGNSYIDAQDLLDDLHWGDGLDTDKNGFVADSFGWNFRVAADESFPPNNPRDALGHGTHVAGTIGAIGNNDRGVTGINWRSSRMALKFLDDRNQGLTSDAVLALNYATMMRTDFGENVLVLNASWNQSGGYNVALRTAIEAASEAGLLLVAAAGNGNVPGQGINIDREPFYLAGYDLDNIITVAATGPHDELASFTNFGAASVDLAPPGIGVQSTLPGGPLRHRERREHGRLARGRNSCFDSVRLPLRNRIGSQAGDPGKRGFAPRLGGEDRNRRPLEQQADARLARLRSASHSGQRHRCERRRRCGQPYCGAILGSAWDG